LIFSVQKLRISAASPGFNQRNFDVKVKPDPIDTSILFLTPTNPSDTEIIDEDINENI